MMYSIRLSKAASNDLVKIKHLSQKCKFLLALIEKDPFAPTPPYEPLIGDLDGYYSRRINIQHHLVYSVSEEKKEITICRMWSHYE